jgi:hypothetical protein
MGNKHGYIVKTKDGDNYVRVHNNIARNIHLTMKEKGMLLALLSLPPDWTVHIDQLQNFFVDGRDSTRAAFNGLLKKGFILSVDHRDKTGKFEGNSYIVYYESQTLPEMMIETSEDPIKSEIQPHTENPYTGNPDTDNPTLQRKSIKRKNIQSNISTDFEEVWSLYPNKKDVAKARKYYNAKIRESERADIKAAVISYANKRKGLEKDQYTIGGGNFFANERWREHVPTKEEVDAVKIPQIPQADGIDSDKLAQLWKLALKQVNPKSAFESYCFYEKNK